MSAGVAPAAGGARRSTIAVGLLGRDVALAAVLGALQTLVFVHTSAWPLQLLCLAALAWRCARVRPRAAAALGLAFGIGWLGAGTWWLFVSLHRYGGLPAPLAVTAVALLCALLSIYLAAALAAFARWRSGRRLRDAFLFAAVWLLAELARGEIFTGFPWLATGYAQVDSPLRGFAPWVGVYGVGFMTVLLAAWVGLCVAGAGDAVLRPGREGVPSAGRAAAPAANPARDAWMRAGLAALLGGLLVLVAGRLAGSVGFSEPTGTLRVSLLQGNVPQDEKFAVEHLAQTLGWTAEHLLAAEGDLVVAPETVIPLLPEQLDPAYWQTLTRHFVQPGRAAVVGLPLGNDALGYTNSAAGLSAAASGGDFYRYDKHHLVPFGEFVPNGFHWFTRMMNIPLGDFNRGALRQPSFRVGAERVAPNICYEDLFGEELAARFGAAASAPTMFANLSNIAWFGKTVAIEQHLQISRMRTLEFERPMLRATNTGATAIIDHRGKVTAALAPYTQGVLEGTVEGRSGLTPYARWAGALGLWPGWLLGAGLLAGAIRRGART